MAGLDRTGALDTLRSVLQRNGDAIAEMRCELSTRRDVAARALAFERAAQVQAAAEALDWLVSEQKVATTHGGADHDVAGWAQGVLVGFAVRDCSAPWTQRRCSEVTALPRLAATRPGWESFARHNAQLAAAVVS